jgi:hypothetical protein
MPYRRLSWRSPNRQPKRYVGDAAPAPAGPLSLREDHLGAGLLRDDQVADPPRMAPKSPDHLAMEIARWLRDFCVTQ